LSVANLPFDSPEDKFIGLAKKSWAVILSRTLGIQKAHKASLVPLDVYQHTILNISQ
jgi:hypothetical protein